MEDRAEAFLKSLSSGQRAVALFDFDDAERFRWQYTPGPRGGLPLKDMSAPQRDLALALVDAGLSESGARTARDIIRHELVLRRLEEAAGDLGSSRRDRQRYYFSVFGDPASDHPWAWRLGGHHLCLHFTIVGGAVATTPLFFGANPARVRRQDPKHDRRLLAPEEDLARELVAGLDAVQRRRAVVSSTPPNDIVTRNAARVEITQIANGIGYDELTPRQQRRFGALVTRYVGRVRNSVAVNMEELSFAWAGSTEVGKGHYYAVVGPTFLIEYDNTQNSANHIHTVWRDVAADWGADLLASHYRSHHC
jgi:Protein of unknown function (DUF3500)